MKPQAGKYEINPLWFDWEELKEKQDKMVYLDNAATTYHKPECVWQAMETANRYLSVNAGRGSYELAQIAMEGMDKLRMELLNLINGRNEAEVVFTSSATVAFNEIIGGLMLDSQDRVYVSPFEHNAVMRTLHLHNKKDRFSIEIIPIDKETLEIDLDRLEYMFREKPPTHVFVTKVSNVTGYILPTEEIFYMAKSITNGQALVFIDGAQSFGLVETDYQKTPYDAFVFAGHKTLYGPFGVAGFIKNRNLKLKPFLAGGTGSNSLVLDMPEGMNGLEPSSPNIIAMAGLYAGLQFIKKETILAIYEHEKRLTEELVCGLRGVTKLKLFVPHNQEAHIGIVSFAMKEYRADEVGLILDEEYKIAVRTGYHCAPLIHNYLKDDQYSGTVRVGIGYFNSKQDMERLVQAVKEIAWEG